MEVVCSLVGENMNYKSNTRSESVSPSTGCKEESEVSVKIGGPFVVTTILIVTGLLLVCAVGGGIVLGKVVRMRRNRRKTIECCDVYAPRVTYISVQSYAEVGSWPSYTTVQSYADVRSDSSNATGYDNVAVQ
jgi:hypothetical protein